MTPSPPTEPPRALRLQKPWLWLASLHAALGVAAVAQIYASPVGDLPILDESTYLLWGRQLARYDPFLLGNPYLDGLYPYVVALLVKVGGSTLLVRLFNVALGAVAVGLVYRVGERFFSRAAGAWAALLLAGSGPLLLEEASVSPLPLVVVAVLGALLLSSDAAEVPRARGFALGLVLGALTLLSGLFALVAGVPLAGLWRTGGAKAAGLFALGFLLALSPLVLRNAIATGEAWPNVTMAGPKLYEGNHPDATGAFWQPDFVHQGPLVRVKDYRAEATRRVGHPLTSLGVSAFWAGEAGRFVLHQPLAAARLLGRKALMLLNGYEVPQTRSLYCTRELFLRVLRFAQADFGLLFPLALPGLILWWRGRRQRGALAAGALYAGLLVATFVTSPLRLPLVPLLCLAAGVTVGQLVELVRRAGRGERSTALKPLAGVALPALLGVALTQLPLSGLAFTDAEVATCAGNAGVALDEQGRSEEAIVLLERALAVDPANVDVTFALGVARFNARRFDEARAAFQQVLAAQPSHPQAHLNLGLLDERAGRWADAAAHFKVVREQRLHNPRAVLFELHALERLGRPEEAAAALDDFLSHLPNDPDRLRAGLPVLASALLHQQPPACAAVHRVGQEAVRREVVLPQRLLAEYAARCVQEGAAAPPSPPLAPVPALAPAPAPSQPTLP